MASVKHSTEVDAWSAKYDNPKKDVMLKAWCEWKSAPAQTTRKPAR